MRQKSKNRRNTQKETDGTLRQTEGKQRDCHVLEVGLMP